MRVYNPKNSSLDMPVTGMQRISIDPKSVSKDIMPSTDFLSLVVSTFGYDDLALIVSGPFEINLCASVSGSVGFVVHSLEDAIARFTKEEEVEITKPTVEEPDHTSCECGEKGSCSDCNEEICEPAEETVKEELPEEVIEEELPKSKKKKKVVKKASK